MQANYRYLFCRFFAASVSAINGSLWYSALTRAHLIFRPLTSFCFSSFSSLWNWHCCDISKQRERGYKYCSCEWKTIWGTSKQIAYRHCPQVIGYVQDVRKKPKQNDEGIWSWPASAWMLALRLVLGAVLCNLFRHFILSLNQVHWYPSKAFLCTERLFLLWTMRLVGLCIPARINIPLFSCLLEHVADCRRII